MKTKTQKFSDAFHKQHNTEEHQGKIGNCIAQLLLLKKKRNGLYNTAWGTKTDLGLYLTVKRIIDEERINI